MCMCVCVLCDLWMLSIWVCVLNVCDFLMMTLSRVYLKQNRICTSWCNVLVTHDGTDWPHTLVSLCEPSLYNFLYFLHHSLVFLLLFYKYSLDLFAFLLHVFIFSPDLNLCEGLTCQPVQQRSPGSKKGKVAFTYAVACFSIRACLSDPNPPVFVILMRARLQMQPCCILKQIMYE